MGENPTWRYIHPRESAKRDVLMQHMILQLYEQGQQTPARTVTMPLSNLKISLRFLPANVRRSLDQDEIELESCQELIKEKELRGTLIEIANSNGKLVISIS